jgi:hypothetical protein
VRLSRVSVDCREPVCCWRKDESVERESEMRRSEERSLSSLKCDVHCAMSWTNCQLSSGSGVSAFIQKRGPRREALWWQFVGFVCVIEGVAYLWAATVVFQRGDAPVRTVRS